jgi:hypothetical protein
MINLITSSTTDPRMLSVISDGSLLTFQYKWPFLDVIATNQLYILYLLLITISYICMPSKLQKCFSFTINFGVFYDYNMIKNRWVFSSGVTVL